MPKLNTNHERADVPSNRRLFYILESSDLPDVPLVCGVFDLSADSFEHTLGRSYMSSVENLLVEIFKNKCQQIID